MPLLEKVGPGKYNYATPAYTPHASRLVLCGWQFRSTYSGSDARSKTGEALHGAEGLVLQIILDFNLAPRGSPEEVMCT